MKNTKWKKYIFEFLSIFIAVVSAFALTNWNENKNDKQSEQKILLEIKNGLDRDIQDFNNNILGHKISLRANEVFRDLIENKAIPQDSIEKFYIALFRDYTPVINRSGYESLKANGLKTIINDSLRFQIISLYDYSHVIIEKLEDNVTEMQSFENYFAPVNELLHPYMEFDNSGKFKMFHKPEKLTETEKKELLSYLWRLETNRRYKLRKYDLVIATIKKVRTNIEKELKL